MDFKWHVVSGGFQQSDTVLLSVSTRTQQPYFGISEMMIPADKIQDLVQQCSSATVGSLAFTITPSLH
jgi:hypothetical protein